MKNASLWIQRANLAKLILCALLFSLMTTAAMAQAGRGAVSGIVTDPTEAVLPHTELTLTNAATGTKRVLESNSSGSFAFISLNPGTYDLIARAKGFTTLLQRHITVSVDQTTRLHLELTLGSVAQVVTINASNDLTAMTNSAVGQLISAATIDRVPLLTRNVYDLIQLSPGVTPANGSPNSSSSQLINSINSGRPGINVSSYTINGAVIGSVYYMIDGSPIGIAEAGAGAIMPAFEISEDAVEETRMETQNTPASYQSGGAGVISLVTQSGGSKFHGEAFSVIRPDVMASNEYFNKQDQLSEQQQNTPPNFHRYQEGASLGGPILRNQLFFFADYEATQQQTYDGSNIYTVPTSAERTGNFSADSFTIYNPMLPDNADGTRQAFENNIITNPNPIGLKFLSMMPKCNYPNPTTCEANTTGALNNFHLPGTDPSKAQKVDARIDWDQSQKQHIFGRYSYAHSTQALVNAFGNMWDPFYAQNTTNAFNALVADDLTFNSNSVLELRYSFTRHQENQTGDPAQTGFDITSMGFPASLAAEQTYKTLPTALFSDVGGGVGGTTNSNTFLFVSENSDFNATLTHIVGKHQISFGFEYMKRYMNVASPVAPAGSYNFDVSATDQSVNGGVGGSDFASLLIGMGEAPGNESDNFTRDLFSAQSSPYYAAFIEDTYHPLTNLTITAGLRWDVFGGRNERHNRMEYFNPTLQASSQGVSYTGAEVFVNAHHRSAFDTNMLDFGPRLGMTWQPWSHTVIRGGAGIYYGPSQEMPIADINSDGYSSTTSWNATCYNADQNTVLNGSSSCVGASSGSPAPSSTGNYSLSNPFPNGVAPIFTQPPSGYANNLGTTLNTVLRSEHTPTTYNYNFGVEYQFPHNIVLSAAYVGSRGLHLPMGSTDLNTLSLATIQRYKDSLCIVSSDPNCELVNNQWAAIQPSTNANYGAATVPLWVSVQEFPQFGSGQYGSGSGVAILGDPVGDSSYNSLALKLQKRLTTHFTMLSSYSWAKLMTNDSQPPLSFVGSHIGVPQDSKDLQYEHAVSPQDVKYQWTAEASYDLPIGRGRMIQLNRAGDLLLGEWTINGIVYVSSGIPIASPMVGAPVAYFNQRANLTCNPGKGAPRTTSTWFTAACFTTPSSAFVPGTAPAYLDHIRTMGARDLDLSLYKSFSMGGARSLRFEISSYNVANHPQFGMPNVPSMTDIATQPTVAATFGQITNTVNSPRQFQFGARFKF